MSNSSSQEALIAAVAAVCERVNGEEIRQLKEQVLKLKERIEVLEEVHVL